MKKQTARQIEEYRPINVLAKYPYVRSRKLLDSSRGQVCTLNFEGCNYSTDTTVAAHNNTQDCGKGTGIKASDVYSVDACSQCHDILDGRKPTMLTDEAKQRAFWRAYIKTTNRRLAEGLIKVEGA